VSNRDHPTSRAPIAAAVLGQEFQWLAGWYYALLLLDHDSEVVSISIEAPKVGPVDDIVIHPGTKSGRYFQVKYSVDASNPIDEEFWTGKTDGGQSFLQRLWKVFIELRKTQSQPELVLYTNRPMDSAHAILKLRDSKTGRLGDALHKGLAVTARKEWEKHIGITTDQLLDLLDHLVISIDQRSERDFIDSIADRMAVYGLTRNVELGRSVVRDWVTTGVRHVDRDRMLLEIEQRKLRERSPFILPNEHGQGLRGGLEHGKYLLLPKLPRNFTGREEYLSILQDWLADGDDRAITISGEGGIGKTALVAHFLDRQLREAPERLPNVVVFYTAKKTLWDIHGIERIRNAGDSVDDAVRLVLQAVAQTFDTAPDFRAVDFSGNQLIERTREFLRGAVDRDDVLLIVDNAETLDERGQILGPLLKKVTSNLARIIVTSREKKYENFASNEIEIKPLPESEAIRFLRKWGYDSGAEPIRDAPDARLLKVIRSLRGSPLRLGAFVRLVTQRHIGIDDAVHALQERGWRDLPEFLYAPAWMSLSEEVQLVLVALALDGGAARKEHVGTLCASLDVPRSDFEVEGRSTYLFRVIRDDDDFVIEHLAVDWLTKKYAELDANAKARVADARKKAAAKLHQYVDDYTDHERAAYRLAIADTAIRTWRARNLDDANALFKQALELDPENGALHERYAAFFLDKGDENSALVQCDYAQKKGAPASEVEYTRARAYCQLKWFHQAHPALDSAIAGGKNAQETSLLRWQLVAYELEDTLKNLKTRQSGDRLAARQRAVFYLDAQFPEPAAQIQLRNEGKRVDAMSVAERAAAYQLAGPDVVLRRAARALVDLDARTIGFTNPAEVNALPLFAELPAALLVVQAIDYHLDAPRADASVNWVDLFEGDSAKTRRQLKNTSLWNERLYPELANACRQIEATGKKRILVRGHGRLSAAFVTGQFLPDTRGFQLEWEQHGTPWRSVTKPAAVEIPQAKVEPYAWGDDLAVGINVIHDRFDEDVRKYLTDSQLPIRGFLPLRSPVIGNKSMPDDAYALGFVQWVLRSIVAEVRAHKTPKIHLFMAAPLPVALFLGHLSNLLPAVQLYEDQNPGYAPTFVVPA